MLSRPLRERIIEREVPDAGRGRALRQSTPRRALAELNVVKPEIVRRAMASALAFRGLSATCSASARISAFRVRRQFNYTARRLLVAQIHLSI